MSRKMQPLPPDVTLRDLFTHKSRVCRQLARIFHSGAMVTTKDLCALTNMSPGYVLLATKTLKEHKLVYVCDWRKGGSTSLLPVYKAGNFSDVAKPPPLSPMRRRDNKKKIEKTEEQPDETGAIYQELASALVPRRTEEEQHDVNWMYLNWISER